VKVRNVHERALDAPVERVGALIDSLSSRADRLWPWERWPPLRLDRGLVAGATGGHGPVRYRVEEYEPGECVVFRFTGPRGFRGTHGYRLERDGARRTVLRHELEMEPAGPALITWPLFFRPLHDALVEDSLDKAEREVVGSVRTPRRWSRRVRLLRAVARRVGRLRPRDP
jgi:hypothetical protein